MGGLSNKIPPDFSDYFSRRLAAAIAESYGPRGIAEFVRQCGLPRRTVENYLAGRSVPDLRQLERIVPHLKVDPSWLVFGAGATTADGLIADSRERYDAARALDRAAKHLREAEAALRGSLARTGVKKEAS